jgi:hypothetical protein
MTKPKKADLAKAKVEHRRLREIDAAAAMAEYHAAKAVDLQNMAQLKALRLAKEAADRDAASNEGAPSKRRAPEQHPPNARSS